MQYRFYTADVFTDRAFGGNPLAVFPDASGLNTTQMQTITREFNYSESTFVFPPTTSTGTRRVRIFTPAAELPFAGHPTVGTAFVLAAIGEVPLTGDLTQIVLEEGVGPVRVAIRSVDGRPVFSQLSAARSPQLGPEPPPVGDLAALLSLSPDDLLVGGYTPQAVSCGVPFLFVPVASLAAVERARLRRELWEEVLRPYWAPEIYFFSFEAVRPGSDLHARMFAPGLGVGEDPATGAAATALAAYLAARQPQASGTLRWIAEQGFEMGRPSILEIEADQRNGQVTAIRVGGCSVLISQGTMEVPAMVESQARL